MRRSDHCDHRKRATAPHGAERRKSSRLGVETGTNHRRAFERTVLMERMRRQHAEVRSALATAERAAQALEDADLELRKVQPVERSPASRMPPGTVKSHVKRVLRKLHASNRTEAASIYARFAVSG